MDKMVEHGVANLHLFNVMLKFCKSSGEMREVIDVTMAKAKLKPDVVTYNTLVGRLRMEDDDAAAESVVEVMKKAGVEPNGRTLEMLNLPSRGENLSKMRTSISKLSHLGSDGASQEVEDGGLSEEEDPKEDLSKFTVLQLKDMLRGKGLGVSGRKAELMRRLEEAE